LFENDDMKQRARRDEDKAERVGAILAAARELWSRSSWNEFSVGAVAARAGIVKGTVYLYFPSKERLLLAVFESSLDEYCSDVDRDLAQRHSRWSATHVAETLAKHLRHRDPFLRLFPLLGPILEHNVDALSALSFKRLLLERLSATGQLIERRARMLHEGDGLRFLLRVTAFLTGLAAMAFPSPVIEGVIEQDWQLRALRIDLHREFVEGATALLRGMEK
jgi:AcrR family transcriptional regulator